MNDKTTALKLSIAVKLIKGVIFLYALVLAFFFLFQDKFLYHPTREIITTPAEDGLSFDEVVFHTAGGLRLTGWYVYAAPDKGLQARGVVLFCHGNSRNISHRTDMLKIFAAMGLDTFIFDYRGFGESEGRPGEDGIYVDTQTAWDYLVKERKISPEKVIIYGRSLGGGAASKLATRVEPSAVVLESTFTSVPDLASEFYPYIPAKLLSRSSYDNIGRVGDIKAPLLIVHSRDDELIPISHGLELAKTAGSDALFVEITGSHNKGFESSGEAFSGPLSAFVTRHLRQESMP